MNNAMEQNDGWLVRLMPRPFRKAHQFYSMVSQSIFNPIESVHWRMTLLRKYWLCALAAATLLPFLLYIPVWITLVSLLIVLSVALKGWRGYSGLSQSWSSWLAILVIALLLVQFGFVFHRDIAAGALCLLCALKLFETKRMADAHFTLSIVIFLATSLLLYNDSMGMAVYVFVLVVGTFIGMHIVTVDRAQMLESSLKRTFLLCLKALPLAILLFLVFPRIHGPLWGLPEHSGQAISGLADEMNPGSISRLTQSTGKAFTAKFHSVAPSASQLYWRAYVLWETDGKRWQRWQRNEEHDNDSKFEIKAIGKGTNYTVIMEPHHRKWMAALDIPILRNQATRLSRDGQIFANKKVKERKRYDVISYTDFQLHGLSVRERQMALKLPDNFHRQTRILAKTWLEELGQDYHYGIKLDDTLRSQMVEKALNYFSDNEYFYTTQPKILSGDVVDEFMFSSREGFCEHFASAFVVLMRSAGIPARVVTGYQGGELNPLGEFYVLRHYDAHAWAEVWYEHEGWVRVDPTAAVSPARIRNGANVFQNQNVTDPIFGNAMPSSVVDFWKRLRQTTDFINNVWIEWVLDYSPQKQANLLQKFGVNAKNILNLVLLVIAIIVGAFLLYSLLNLAQPSHRSPVVRYYTKLCNQIGRKGWPRKPSEGPVEYANRVAKMWPEGAKYVEDAVNIYVSIRYAGAQVDLQHFKQAVERVKHASR